MTDEMWSEQYRTFEFRSSISRRSCLGIPKMETSIHSVLEAVKFF